MDILSAAALSITILSNSSGGATTMTNTTSRWETMDECQSALQIAFADVTFLNVFNRLNPKSSVLEKSESRIVFEYALDIGSIKWMGTCKPVNVSK